MLYLIDRRTGFYFNNLHEGYIGEEESDIPSLVREDPKVMCEYFDSEDEGDVITDMFNSGIFSVKMRNKTIKIDIDNVSWLSPNYMEYYLSAYKNGEKKYEKLLWNEKAYFIVKIKEEPEFLITEIDGKKYYVIFASKIEADDLIRSDPEKFEDFSSRMYYLDKDFRYCLIGCKTTVLLDKSDDKEE